MARLLYFDCFSGASGDMILGALVDTGLRIDGLRDVVASLRLDGVTLATERVDRNGVGATKFRVRTDGGLAPPGHEHHHHRGLAEIIEIVDRSDLSATSKTRAGGLFRRLAEIEAAIHQRPVEEIHLHEVGALDSIVDVVGAVFLLEELAADRIVASSLNVGSGTVRCEHGELPVPAPATARIVEGVPIYSTGVRAELLTPTGALVVTAYADAYGPIPSMEVRQIGYGAGDLDLKGTPNVLRVLVGEAVEIGTFEQVIVIECEIDDMNPQIFGVLMERLYEEGALDVFYTPIQMKKNRPGTLVTVVALPQHRELLSDVFFKETTTIGVRFTEMSRERLQRDEIAVETPIGQIRFKVARRDGVAINAAPEFEDCARAAREHGLSVKDVQAIATKAYLERK